jgi:hypothetical protein
MLQARRPLHAVAPVLKEVEDTFQPHPEIKASKSSTVLTLSSTSQLSTATRVFVARLGRTELSG